MIAPAPTCSVVVQVGARCNAPKTSAHGPVYAPIDGRATPTPSAFGAAQ